MSKNQQHDALYFFRKRFAILSFNMKIKTFCWWLAGAFLFKKVRVLRKDMFDYIAMEYLPINCYSY